VSAGLKTLNVESVATNVLERPDSRLRLAALLAAVPLLLVFARILQVTSSEQLVLSGDGVLRSVLEPIPARNGRILSADGRVLAEDIESFSLLVNYRWFEEPPNTSWLRGEALRRLSRSERRQREAVQTAERQVIEQRNALWEDLSRLSGLDVPELQTRFQEHQARVVALKSAVEEQRAEQNGFDAPKQAIVASTWWEAAYQNLREALTTSPRPRSEEPLVLAEEQQEYEIASGLPLAVAAEIESDPDRFPGTQVRLTSQRHYPYGTTAAHLIGYRFRDEDGERDEPREAGGQTGIERSYERHLQGVDGVRRTWLNRRSETVREVVLQEPRIGRDLVLNIDFALQQELEALLDRAVASAHGASEAVPASAGGCIVALDVRTGAVLASASAPRFDLQPASMRDPAFWTANASAETRPMFDRATSAALPPGSVFKAITAAALLDSRQIDPDAPFECIGYLGRKDRHRDYIFRHFGVGHGSTTMTSALAQSCNVYFFHVAKILGAEPILSWAERFGFGRPTGIDLPRETAGHLPTSVRSADALGLAIGQADLTASPLQVVRAMAAIANGGRLVTPHVVRGSGPQAGGSNIRPVLRTEPVPRLTSTMLGRIREALEQVVSHPLGSGYKSVRHPKIAIAGKTGTAEVGGDLPDHAWFAGYAPADAPKVAFVVLLENAGSGGQAAGPVARQTVEALDRRGFLNASP
jgi:penicillin-binding protein 2